MAKVIANDADTRYVGGPYPWVYVVVLGAVIGALVWGSSLLLERYVIDPLACGASTIVACGRSYEIAVGIATVFGLIIGVWGLLRIGIYRPLIAALASLGVLWSLPLWVVGLAWYEALLFCMGSYAISYALFGWIMRYSRLIPVLIATVLIVVTIRIVLAYW